MSTPGPDRVREPIIILGAPRSGTTLLARLLGSHPEVALAGEPRMVWRFGNDRRSDELRPEHATPEVVQHIRTYFAAVVASQSASRLVEKTPSNSVRPAFVNAVFPDARFVHIVRNGWSAVPSIYRFWGTRGRGFDQKQARKLVRRLKEARPSQIPFYMRELAGRARAGPGRPEPLYGPRLAGLRQTVDEVGRLEASALQWRTCVEQSAVFGRSLGPSRYFELKLEELDRQKVGELLDFCGLAASEELLQEFDALYEPERASGRGRVSLEQARRMAPYVTSANSWLGYPDEGPEQVGDPSLDRQAEPSFPPALCLAYIVGVKNCGSTLLDALIGQAEGVRSLGEVAGFYRYREANVCGCGLEAASCGPCRALVRGLGATGELGRLQDLYRQPLKERRIYWALMPLPGRRRYARLSDRMLDLVAADTGCRVLVDSSKNISRGAALAFESRHEVKIVHLIRDGRGFLASRRRRASVDGTAYRPTRALMEWLGKNLGISLLLGTRLGSARYLMCRYEDLLKDPQFELDRIGAFLGIDLGGVADRARVTGVPRAHLFEPERRFSYHLVTLDSSRLESQQWSGLRNLVYWACGGWVSALWRYDRAQSYLKR